MIDVNILKQIFTGNTGSQSVQNNFYATVISQNDNEILVQLDGSELTLPIIVGDGGANTVSVSSNDRVLVRIENNRAFIDSNVGDISASSADVAQNTENIEVAVEAADTAMSAAEEANTAAQNATDAAASATSAAATAQSAAESAATDAGEALTKANAADAKAVTAQSTAESADTKATTAQSTASAAQSAAQSAASDASDALSAATAADSKAVAAQSTANNALSTAQSASRTATATAAHVSYVTTGTRAGLHVHEADIDYTSGSDAWINPNGINLRYDDETIASFTPSYSKICGDDFTMGQIDTHLYGIKCDKSSFAIMNSDGFNIDFGGDKILVYQSPQSWEFMPPGNFNVRGSVSLDTGLFLGNMGYPCPVFLDNDCGQSGQVLVSSGLHSSPRWVNMPVIPEPLPFCKAVRTASTTTSSTASTITNVTLQSLELNTGAFTISGGGVKCPRAGVIRIKELFTIHRPHPLHRPVAISPRTALRLWVSGSTVLISHHAARLSRLQRTTSSI